MHRFGERVATELYNLNRECEANPPTLQQYNAWGQRVDNIITCDAWNKMKQAAAEEGLIAIAYERKYQQFRYEILMVELSSGTHFNNN